MSVKKQQNVFHLFWCLTVIQWAWRQAGNDFTLFLWLTVTQSHSKMTACLREKKTQNNKYFTVTASDLWWDLRLLPERWQTVLGSHLWPQNRTGWHVSSSWVLSQTGVKAMLRRDVIKLPYLIPQMDMTVTQAARYHFLADRWLSWKMLQIAFCVPGSIILICSCLFHCKWKKKTEQGGWQTIDTVMLQPALNSSGQIIMVWSYCPSWNYVYRAVVCDK